MKKSIIKRYQSISMTQRRICKELPIYANKTDGVKMVKNKKPYLVDVFLTVQWGPVGVFEMGVLQQHSFVSESLLPAHCLKDEAELCQWVFRWKSGI